MSLFACNQTKTVQNSPLLALCCVNMIIERHREEEKRNTRTGAISHKKYSSHLVRSSSFCLIACN